MNDNGGGLGREGEEVDEDVAGDGQKGKRNRGGHGVKEKKKGRELRRSCCDSDLNRKKTRRGRWIKELLVMAPD
ncbi:hypothetical protein CDL15_Pgr004661 [Punica granatum]|uniref:Uncharacterized protein n=1 Tax=Punica granatum TaxID=22663 RepID=A0A218WQF1_PUNGR|nr:hypothetical protein CDL15_Pgr004661 [Punica granatum]